VCNNNNPDHSKRKFESFFSTDVCVNFLSCCIDLTINNCIYYYIFITIIFHHIFIIVLNFIDMTVFVKEIKCVSCEVELFFDMYIS
jgi:hypothetical protein